MRATLIPALLALTLLAACSDSDSRRSTATGTGPGSGSSSSITSATLGGNRNVRPGSQEDLAANVGNTVYFDTDKSTLSGSSALAQGNTTTLDRQAAWLQQYPQNRVEIAGNCDERGTQEYNLALGQRRALAAANYLVAKGVAQSRMTVISYGKERPIDPASNQEAWAKNRNALTSVR